MQQPMWVRIGTSERVAHTGYGLKVNGIWGDVACSGDMRSCTEVPPVVLLTLLPNVPDGDCGGRVSLENALQNFHFIWLLDLLYSAASFIHGDLGIRVW